MRISECTRCASSEFVLGDLHLRESSEALYTIRCSRCDSCIELVSLHSIVDSARSQDTLKRARAGALLREAIAREALHN